MNQIESSKKFNSFTIDPFNISHPPLKLTLFVTNWYNWDVSFEIRHGVKIASETFSITKLQLKSNVKNSE
jgi:hypothetical protein